MQGSLLSLVLFGFKDRGSGKEFQKDFLGCSKVIRKILTWGYARGRLCSGFLIGIMD